MTAIVGLVDNGTVYMGADSAGVDSCYNLTVRADRKLFIKKDFLFGFTSSFRMGQLLQYKLSLPIRDKEQDIFNFMVCDFVEAVRTCLKQGGYAKKDNEVESSGTFLVGYQGRLFKIDSDYQVGENVCGYDACGCGESYALGSLFSHNGHMEGEPRVLLALEAAQQFSAGVRGPFFVEKI